MKAMIVSDFAVLRSAILQLLGICAIIALFMGYAMGTLVGGAAAITAMPPFMLLFSLAATDEQNGWERFRLTLPSLAARWCSAATRASRSSPSARSSLP